MSVNSCVTCGGNKFFLREKGPNVGLYCSMCEKWQKWVSKKDLPTFKRQGYKVYPADYVPDTLGVVDDKPIFEPIKNDSGYDFGGQPSSKLIQSVATVNRQQNIFNGSDSVEPDFEPDEDENDYNHSGDFHCNTCLTARMNVLSGTSTVSVLHDDKLLLISDSTGTKLLASIEIKYCPTCGRRL